MHKSTFNKDITGLHSKKFFQKIYKLAINEIAKMLTHSRLLFQELCLHRKKDCFFVGR